MACVSALRGRIIQDLANLRQLDGEEISKLEKLEVGFEISSEEEGDDDDPDDEGGEEETGTSTRTELAAAREPKPTLGAYRTKLPDIEGKCQTPSVLHRAIYAMSLHRIVEYSPVQHHTVRTEDSRVEPLFSDQTSSVFP